jgi:signal transduction histidine kinase
MNIINDVKDVKIMEKNFNDIEFNINLISEAKVKISNKLEFNANLISEAKFKINNTIELNTRLLHMLVDDTNALVNRIDEYSDYDFNEVEIEQMNKFLDTMKKMVDRNRTLINDNNRMDKVLHQMNVLIEDNKDEFNIMDELLNKISEDEKNKKKLGKNEIDSINLIIVCVDTLVEFHKDKMDAFVNRAVLAVNNFEKIVKANKNVINGIYNEINVVIEAYEIKEINRIEKINKLLEESTSKFSKE